MKITFQGLAFPDNYRAAKKALPFLVLLFVCSFASATNYYFSSVSGDDTRTSTQAQNPSTPWRSITKYNSFFASLQPGDSCLFKRGETFFGTLTPSRSGTSLLPIITGAYGTGADPVITGFTTITSWVAKGGGIYESASALSGVSSVNMVTVNGVNTGMGRTPNPNSTNGGLDSIITSTSTSLTVYGLQAAAVPGAQMVTRTRRWIWDITPIETRVGNTVTVAAGAFTYTPSPKNGTFIQNSIDCLDQNGEWYFNPNTGKFSIYSNSGIPTGVKVAILNNVVLISNRSWLKFVGLDIEGSNSHAVAINAGTNIFILDGKIKFGGDCGINGNSSSHHLTFSPDSVVDCQNNGIEVNDGDFSMTDFVVKNTSLIPGMGKIPGPGNSGESRGFGVAIRIFDQNGLVQNFKILNSGYNGLGFKNNQGAATSNNLLIENFLIDSSCLNKDDGAGIYTWAKGTHTPYSNRIIRHGIIRNSVGYRFGTNSVFASAYGFYGDEGASQIQISDVEMANCGRAGFFLNEGSHDISLRNCKIYNNGISMGTSQDGTQLFFNESDAVRILNDTIRNNEIWATGNRYLVKTINSGTATFSAVIDSNAYVYNSSLRATPFNSKTSLGSTSNTIAAWRGRGFDAKYDTTTISTSTVIKDVYAPDRDSSFLLLGYNWANAKKTVFSGFAATVRRWESLVIRRTTLNGLNPPTVTLFSPAVFATFTSPATITISATAFDVNGTITDVKFYNGTTLLNTDASSPYSYNWTNVAPGNYTITAKATDNDGLSTTSAPVTVTVSNSKPVVSITSPANGTTYATGATVAIAATATDDGSIARVNFYVDGVFKGTDNSSPYTLNWISTVGGHSLTANAIDNLGDSTISAPISITAFTTNIPPTVSVTTPTKDTAFQGAATVRLIATTGDADGTVSRVHFYDNGVLVQNEITAPWDYNQALGLGVHNITAVAIDNTGDSTTSAVRKITITNIPPTVSITSPPNDSSYFEPATIVINATASDDGSVSTVHFYKNGVYAGLDNSSPYTITFSSVAAGGYTFTATAIDNLGDSTSATVNITVVTPVYIPPDTLSISVTITSPILCNGGTATVNVSATGGTEPYSGTGDFTKSAGVYDFIITDANGLKDTLRMSVPEPGALSATVSSDTIAVYLGSVNKTINPLGGTAPYQYSINGGVTWQTGNVFKLYAGSYTVTVKDANNCTTTVSFSLTQPPPAGNYIIHKRGRKFLNL